MHRERPLAYDQRVLPGVNGLVKQAIFTCADCERRAILTIGTASHPDALANRLKKQGWHVAAHMPRRGIRCDDCLRGRKDAAEANGIASDLRKIIAAKAARATLAMMSSPACLEIAAGTLPLSNLEPTMSTSLAMTAPTRSRTPAPVPAGEQPSGNFPPPSDARVAIRTALDKHFDDKVGVYLDGMSDEKIASELAFPRKWVSDIRDAAYGPIRENPEVTVLKAEIEALRKEVASQADLWRGWHSSIDDKFTALANKIEALTRSLRGA